MKKQVAYIFSWIILGILLSFIIHAFTEIGYIESAVSNGIILKSHTIFGRNYCFLPLWFQISLLVFGIVGGYFTGKYFWKVIYIENRCGKIK